MKGAMGVGKREWQLAGGEDARADVFIERGLFGEYPAGPFLRIDDADRLLEVFHHQADRREQVGIAADDHGGFVTVEVPS